MPLVCKRWYGVFSNDNFWKKRYFDCGPYWRAYQSHHLPKTKLAKLLQTTTDFYEKWIANSVDFSIENQKLDGDMLWKQKFFIQYSRNNPQYDQFVKSQTQPVNNQSVNLQPKKTNV